MLNVWIISIVDVFASKKGNVWLYSECITTVRCTVRHQISRKHRGQVDSTRTVNQAIICRGTGRSSGCVVPWCLINYIPWEKTPGCFLFLRDAGVNGAFSQTPLPASNWSNLKIISAVFVASGAPAEYGIIKYRKANFYWFDLPFGPRFLPLFTAFSPPPTATERPYNNSLFGCAFGRAPGGLEHLIFSDGKGENNLSFRCGISGAFRKASP